MKRLLLILFIALITGQAGYCPAKRIIYIPKGEIIDPYKELYEAMGMVESANGKYPYNPIEGAIGKQQIRQIRLDDYNNKANKSYVLSDCYNESITREIWYYYATQIGFRDYERIARSWNGTGAKTKVYWSKIKKQLNKRF